MQLIINKPYIKDDKLISKIQYENKEYEMFFQVKKKHVKYLCDDNCNSFLIALLPFAVKHNYDIKINGDVSSKLYYQLNSYLLPLLCKEFKKNELKITGNLTDVKYNSKGVGASVSLGVDSFYTLLKHQNCDDLAYNITHLCFFNAGSHGNYGGDDARRLYHERLEHIEKFCNENKYELVTVDSNMNELIMMGHQCRNTFTTLACVFALEKLFYKYYFASCFGFNGSHIDSFDTTYYDILNVHCLSNENIDFYLSGMETSRLEKLKYISKFPLTYDYLNVCVGNNYCNCGECSKCIRTLTELESIKKLDLYKNVFDLKKFKENRTKIYSRILYDNKDRVSHEFFQEIIDECKKNKVKIPISSYVLSYLPSKRKVKKFLKKVLPKSILNKRKKISDGWMD